LKISPNMLVCSRMNSLLIDRRSVDILEADTEAAALHRTAGAPLTEKTGCNDERQWLGVTEDGNLLV
jgi:hypothetical protein